MTVGQKIKAARKKRQMRGEDLGSAVGLTKSTISKIENDEVKGRVDNDTLIRISEALNAPDILAHHCQSCPIRQHVLIKYFPELNRIHRQPAVITSKLRKEMKEALVSLEGLGEFYSKVDFQEDPSYRESFQREMEQIIDVKRGIEILEFELLLSGLHSKEDLQEVYDRQQAKCERNGHHRPVKEEAAA